MRRGLIFPRSSMQNPYTAKGLPHFYGRLAYNIKFFYDYSQRTGQNVYDKSGELWNGTLVSGASGTNTSTQHMWDNGNPGGVNFDGTNDYIEINAVSNLNPLRTYLDYDTKWAISFWCKMPTTDTTVKQIIGNYYTPDASNYYGCRAVFYGDAIYIIMISGGTSSSQHKVESISSLVGGVGSYMHVVINKSVTTCNAGDIDIYINGSSASTTNNSINITSTIWGAVFDATDYKMYIGANHYGRGDNYLWFYTDDIIDTRLYNNSLTTDEISVMYNYEKRFVR